MILFFPRMFPARKPLDSHGCQGLSLLDLGPGADTVWLLAEPGQSLYFILFYFIFFFRVSILKLPSMPVNPPVVPLLNPFQTDRPSWDHPFDLLNCFHC